VTESAWATSPDGIKLIRTFCQPQRNLLSQLNATGAHPQAAWPLHCTLIVQELLFSFHGQQLIPVNVFMGLFFPGSGSGGRRFLAWRTAQLGHGGDQPHGFLNGASFYGERSERNKIESTRDHLFLGSRVFTSKERVAMS
jgi:hypothetical protein